jgi:hypothetical protein
MQQKYEKIGWKFWNHWNILFWKTQYFKRFFIFLLKKISLWILFFWGDFFDISKNNIICVETTKGWQLFLKFQIIWKLFY